MRYNVLIVWAFWERYEGFLTKQESSITTYLFEDKEERVIDSFVVSIMCSCFALHKSNLNLCYEWRIDNTVVIEKYSSRNSQFFWAWWHHCVRRYIALLKLIFPRDGITFWFLASFFFPSQLSVMWTICGMKGFLWLFWN